jgi:anti-sigma regulatory factor (Ser/Thr protein kinase)
VARARAFVTDTLRPGHPAAEVAALLVSEVVTNAVLHSGSGAPGGTVTVTVSSTCGGLRVEVGDAGSDRSTPSVHKNPNTCSGHGLLLVDSLADEWGYARSAAGTTVWFCLDA